MDVMAKRIGWGALVLTGVAAVLSFGCSGSGGSSSSGSASAVGNADLVQLACGRLVDVWATDPKGGIQLIERDVVIGTDITDDARAGKPAADVIYTFESADAGTGQEILVIRLDPQLNSDGRPTNPRFLSAFDRLDDNLKDLGSNYYGQNTTAKPFDVAPRNAAFRLMFSRGLGLSQAFFTELGPTGKPVGLRNTRALQLLEIQGDPRDGDPTGDFRVIPARVVYKENSLVLDPVILGEEGPELGIPNNAEGLPASQNAVGANIRIALPLEGTIRIAGLREKSDLLTGPDAYEKKALFRDFRAANAGDNDPSIANGFLNDPIPPRIVGEQLISLLGLEDRGTNGRFLILYQEAMKHTQKYLAVGDEDYYSPVEIDPLDKIELVVRGITVAECMILAPPEKTVHRDAQSNLVLDAYGQPRVTYKARVDLTAEGYAAFERNLNRDPVTQAYLPTEVVQVTTFQAQVVKETKEKVQKVLAKDDPRYFLTFSPPAPDQRYPTDNISPFASVLVRFTKPVDINTLRAFDTLVLSVDKDFATVFEAQKGTAGLIVSRIYDEDGAQRVIRSQPPLGFYHNALAPNSAPKGPWDPNEYRRSGGTQGLPDPTDLFYLYMLVGKDGVKDLAGNPVDLQGATMDYFQVDFTLRADVATNRVANICRRFLNDDEDPNPGVKDIFGAYVLLPGGNIMGRPSTRFTQYVDDLNQQPEPADPNYKFCPPGTIMVPTGSTMLGSPIQNPLNPMGCRLQTCWREVDLSLSRLDPFDFNLDVEQMWWAPFTGLPVYFDIFDKISLYVHHSERRPSPCVGTGSSLPQYANSGLVTTFKNNYLDQSDPVRAFDSEKMEVKDALVVYEPNQKRRYLPLPTFQKPFLVWRDERDLRNGGGDTEPVLSPYLTKGDGTVSAPNFRGSTANSLPTIALPLLADFFVFPDDPELNGKATGFDGWQISFAIQSSPQPNFRVYTAGGYKPPGYPNGQPDKVDPSSQTVAQGGYTPQGARTPAGDNTVYWIRTDFMKRITVVTNGFVALHNPHKGRNSAAISDPRLTNFPAAARPAVFDLVFEPPLAKLAQGTRILPEFRSAQAEGSKVGYTLDPKAACEAHTYTASTDAYFMTTSTYLESPNDLMDPLKLKMVNGTALDPKLVRFFNWRLVFQNNVDVDPPVTPAIDSMGIVYRFDR